MENIKRHIADLRVLFKSPLFPRLCHFLLWSSLSLRRQWPTCTTPFTGSVHRVRYIVFCNWFNALFFSFVPCRCGGYETENGQGRYRIFRCRKTEKCKRIFAIHNSQCMCDILSSPNFASFSTSTMDCSPCVCMCVCAAMLWCLLFTTVLCSYFTAAIVAPSRF